MQYIYETHMHTCQGSACSDTPGHEYIARYQDMGYSGIIITDHFYRGNCRVDRTLPWHAFIDQFCSGYEDAKNEGDKRGFPVFFGWEENISGDEYLIYGLDKAFMLSHPEMPHWTRKQQYEIVHAAGGCVVQAHPFRARDYIHTIYLSPCFVDGIEAVNAANVPQWNSMALRYGEIMGFPMTAGSDNHHVKSMGKENLAGVAFDRPLTDIQDYVQAILEKQSIGMYLPDPVAPWDESMKPDKPAVWLDAQENDSGRDVMDILRNGKV
ncbi:MAG: PHP domain-containing protein [Clostridia bacterium]|nr:PHP domain-containing protein [Clostridia bacterium]